MFKKFYIYKYAKIFKVYFKVNEGIKRIGKSVGLYLCIKNKNNFTLFLYFCSQVVFLQRNPPKAVHCSIF